MNTLKTNNLKLAIQKSGRLTDETLALLREAGFEFESYKQSLYSVCRNFPIDILYLRDDDIPDYVASGAIDIGVVGENLLIEKDIAGSALLKLGYGYCSLKIAVPRESSIMDIRELNGRKVATSYPSSTLSFFKKRNISVETIEIKGSTEIAPTLGLADAIVDLVSTGSTLLLNDLREVEIICDSQAVLMTSTITDFAKMKLMEKFLIRIRGVLSARNYKYVIMNAPENILTEIVETVPGLKSPTVTQLAKSGYISVQTAIKEDVFWETIEKLKAIGASDIIVLPIEKLIL